jgi:hypothetical protein
MQVAKKSEYAGESSSIVRVLSGQMRWVMQLERP